MTLAYGGHTTNLVAYYNKGDDDSLSFGWMVQLCQTFTLNDTYALYEAVVLTDWFMGSHTIYAELFATDVAGKPTGPAIASTRHYHSDSHTFNKFKWRIFKFKTWPVLPAGLYALVIFAPLPADFMRYQWRSDKTPPTYPDGKSWRSLDSGGSWGEIVGQDFMFEIWGYHPPPLPPPEPVINNWAPLTLDQPELPECHTITVTTDILVHLFLRWSTTEPITHKVELYRRGISLPNATRYCFTSWHEVEQEEAGDSLSHSFILCDWPICETRWFYFIGTKQAEASPSASPIFNFHREGVPMYVISLGKLGEAEVLHGEVKLKEGAGIIITRDDANNALEIKAAAPATFLSLTDTPASYAAKRYHSLMVNSAENAVIFRDVRGFGGDWYKFDPSGQLSGSLDFKYDEVQFAVSGVNVDLRLYTRAMRTCGFRRPFSCTIKLARGPDALGNPNVWAAVVQITADIRNNMTQSCIGWKTGPAGQVSCFNGDGIGSTITNFAWGNEPPIWLRWLRRDADIQFYANETLVATHNTNVPVVTKDCFFALQAYGTGAPARTVYMSHPCFQSK